MKALVWILIAFFSFVLLSCAPLYIPNVHNAPLFRGAGEFQTSINFGEGIDAQAAAALTDHIGLMCNYEFADRNTSDNNSNNVDSYTKHQLLEGAIGYYENIGKICYEVFAGYGKGQSSAFGYYTIFGPYDVQVNGKYNRFFIQPSVGSNNHIFNWIVSARISYVDFNKIKDVNGQNPALAINPSPAIYLEPSFTGRVFFGKSPIYSQFQTGFSFSTQSSLEYNYQPFLLTFGIGLRLGGINKTKEIKPD